MAFAWWSQVAARCRAARPRRRASLPALGVERLGERALLSGLTAGGADHPVLRGLLAGLPDPGPGQGAAGLVVVLRGTQPGASPDPGPIFEFDYRPGGGLVVSPVVGEAGTGAGPVPSGRSAPGRTYLVLIPSDELTTSPRLVALLEHEATRAFFDPSGQALVLEMSRRPFRPEERNGGFAPLLERAPPGPGDPGLNELSPADGGEGGHAAQGPGDEAGEVGQAGLAGPQPAQAGANASQESPDDMTAEAEADGPAEWAIPESGGPASLLAPPEAPGPARAALVPLGDNSLSVVPALLAAPAAGAGTTDGARHLPADGPPLAPPPARGEAAPVPPGVGVPADRASPAGLPPG